MAGAVTSPRPSCHGSRVLWPSLVAAAALLLAFAPPAFADALTPESGGSPNADRIDTLYKITFYMGMVIFVAVEGLLIYTLVRYRHRRGNPEPAQIRGNTRLEVGWTVGAALILVVLSVVTFVMLPGIRTPEASGPPASAGAGIQFAATDQPQPPGPRPLEIEVNGQQYLWRFTYPQRGLFSYYEMVVPTNTTVVLRITASDVIHSWWIPKLGGKADATPGHFNMTWFKATRPGVYKGACAELCGENHAQMLAQVRAVPPEEYRAWTERQTAAIADAQRQLAAQRKAREQNTQSPQNQ